MSEIGTRILEAVEALGPRLDVLDARFERLDARLAKVEGTSTSALEQVSGVRIRIEAMPDMHYLAAAAKTQLSRLRELLDKVASIELRMDEIYKSMATDVEIQNLRNDVSRFRDESVDFEVRLSTLEGHVGVTPPGPKGA